MLPNNKFLSSHTISLYITTPSNDTQGNHRDITKCHLRASLSFWILSPSPKGEAENDPLWS
jgi:hypothetical protein